MMTKPICGTPEYWRALRLMHRLLNVLNVAGTPKMDEKSFFADLQEARANPMLVSLLTLERKLHLLDPKFDVENTSEIWGDCGYSSERVYMTPEGVVRIDESSMEDEESSEYSRDAYLNGKLHDIDGEPAVKYRSYHRITEEKHLDDDYVQSWRHGVMLSYVSDDDALRSRLTSVERVYFGYAEEADLKAVAAE